MSLLQNTVPPLFQERLVAEQGLVGLGRFTVALLFALSLGEALLARAESVAAAAALAVGAAAFWSGLVLWLRRPAPDECVAIAGGEIVVTREGEPSQALRLYGLRLDRDETGALWLRLRDQRVEVARALAPAKRAAFASRLRTALREASGAI